MPTPDKYKPVPIGLGSLPGAPTLGDDTSDDPVIVPPVDPVEGAQPEVMRFTAGEYADFGRALSRANLGNLLELATSLGLILKATMKILCTYTLGRPSTFMAGTVKMSVGKA